jgi:glycosyltransferase involved in cell wall biosynthesis
MARTSIIIPTHNRAALLPRAIESARAAGEDVEVIVVDDASTDETPTLCRNMAGIVYLRLEQNGGQANARNVGIGRSSGDFLAFLDDDDLRIPGSIDEQAELLGNNPELSFVYGQVAVGDPKDCRPTGELRPGHLPTGDLFWLLLDGNYIYLPSVLVRKSHFLAAGLFDPSVTGTEDWDAWIRLAEEHSVGVLPKPVGIYRDFTMTSGQTSSNKPRMARASARTLRKALRSPRAIAAGAERRREVHLRYMNSLWEYLVSEGRNALSSGRYRYAAMNFMTAVRLHPGRAVRPAAIASLLWDAARAKSS